MEALHPDIDHVLFSKEEIAQIVQRMGSEIARDYQGKDLVLIAVLRGAVVFMGDLMRAIDAPLAIDFMAVSSYGDGAKSRASCASSRTWTWTSRVATCSSSRTSSILASPCRTS